MGTGLTCRELIEFLDDYVDGCLARAELARFEEHLALCVACRRYLHGYRSTMRLALAACAEADREPEDVPEELVAAILASRAR
jgi:predicted anti-sigma-YlaC factor YlaD